MANQTGLESWKNAKTYTEVLKLNQKYIGGDPDVRITPYTDGPLEPEIIDLVPGLLRLHSHGLLTLESQPASHSIECFREGEDASSEDQSVDIWKEIETKAWLRFIVPLHDDIISEQVVLKFCELLRGRTDFWMTIADLCAPEMIYHRTASDIYIHRRERQAKVAEQVESQTWEDIPLFFVDDGADIQDMDQWVEDLGLVSIKDAYPRVIMLAAMDWDEGCKIEDIVEELAIEAGMPPAFEHNDRVDTDAT